MTQRLMSSSSTKPTHFINLKLALKELKTLSIFSLKTLKLSYREHFNINTLMCKLLQQKKERQT